MDDALHGEKIMFKQFLKSILPLLAILVFQFISPQAQAVCTTTSFGINWDAATWTGCSTSPPTSADDVTISTPVTLNQPVTVNQILLSPGTLNASTITITLTATEPIINAGGTFNADTSTVKLSNANHHSFSTSNFTFYNLQWETPLTAPRTLTINTGVTITKATGGTFNLDGTPTNPVTFAGTGSVSPTITVNNCAASTVTGITCNLPIGNNLVSAPIFSLKDKPAIFSEEVK